MSNINIKTFIERFDNGDFNSIDRKVQIEAGWYDWFCRDTSLKNKTVALATKVKQIAKSSKVDIEKQYVFFKNNCPMYGSLYDDFRICDMETGDVIYTIVPRSGHKSSGNKAEVWGKENGFDGPIVIGTWTDVKRYFGI